VVSIERYSLSKHGNSKAHGGEKNITNVVLLSYFYNVAYNAWCTYKEICILKNVYIGRMESS
jgi:hypothetical protein